MNFKRVYIRKYVLIKVGKLLFIGIALSIPMYLFCIWSLYKPEEAYFFLDKWRYKEIPELSEIQIKLIGIGSIVAMIIITIWLIVIAIDAFTPDTLFPNIGCIRLVQLTGQIS